MSDSGVERYFVFAVIVVGLFAGLVQLMPSEFMSASRKEVVTPVNVWEGAELFLSNITDAANFTATLGSGGDVTLTTIEVDFGWNWYTWDDDYMYFMINYAGWWIFDNYEYVTPYPQTRETVAENFDTSDNSSRTIMHSKQYEFEVTFYYNETAYANITDAWDNGDVNVYVGVGNEDTASSMGAWAVISSILFFSNPDIHPMINFVIAIPLWAMIAITIYTLFLKLIPFLGG